MKIKKKGGQNAILNLTVPILNFYPPWIRLGVSIIFDHNLSQSIIKKIMHFSAFEFAFIFIPIKLRLNRQQYYNLIACNNGELKE